MSLSEIVCFAVDPMVLQPIRTVLTALQCVFSLTVQIIEIDI